MHTNLISLRFFQLAGLLALLFSSVACADLHYTPQVPPENKQLLRQKAIETRIQEEFKDQNLKYKSLAFGQTVTVKPPSFAKLDSLYEIKYQLENSGKRDARLDENIGIQRLICQNDTARILYKEEHVFSLSTDSTSEVLSGTFSLNSRNEIQKVEFRESYVIPSNLTAFYSNYILNESFMWNSPQPTEEEIAFYTIYKARAAELFGKQKEDFIVHTLNMMKIAKNKRSLEKQMFLQELTKRSCHTGIIDYKDAVFSRVDQVSTNNDKIDYYLVEYQYSQKMSDNSYVKKHFIFKYDPYLQLISKDSAL